MLEYCIREFSQLVFQKVQAIQIFAVTENIIVHLS